MKDETKEWFDYAEENFKSAEILLKNHLYNVCLQNVQQAIEKYLKALLTEKSITFSKTHSIRKLINELKTEKIEVDINDEEIDLIDSIYLPSKYPLGSALPDFYPNETICKECIEIAAKVKPKIKKS